MAQIVFLRHLARLTPGVTYARLLRGPARPTWSFRFELFAATMRAVQFELASGSWEAQRRAFDRLAGTYAPTVRRVRRERVTLGGVPAEWFTPKQPARTEATVLYVHGGGYVFGSVRSHQELIARIALAAPARALAPEYRLAPEHPFPAAIDDVVAVYRALLADGVAPSRLVVAGDSAGGGLTMALLQRLKAAGDPLPAGAALICPWVDLTAKGGSLDAHAAFDWSNETVGNRWSATYLNGHDPKDPLASAVFGDLAGLPPLLVQVGGAELIYDQSVALAKRAREAGVDARLVVGEDMIHDWPTFANLFPDCARPIDELGAFIREATKT
ncbi:MAG: alpha/beta hydrolase [Labilithrix sp.]|nr:alpha/beta hydrolase [Labilithrix sp.]MCW5816556.1 alpha/beta hydrolase [Labilithrix sp.]